MPAPPVMVKRIIYIVNGVPDIQTHSAIRVAMPYSEKLLRKRTPHRPA